MRRPAPKPKPKRRKLPIFRVLLSLGVMAGLGFAATRIDLERIKSALPIGYVRVEGPVWYLDDQQFAAALLPHAQRAYFLANLGDIEAAAKQFAWIDQVRAERIWPDTIVVQVVEQRPIARWNDDSLLNDRGEPFTPPDTASFGRLPHLAGPPGREKQVLGMMHSLDDKLQARWLRIDSLRLSKRLAWVARLDNGTEIVFGNQDPLPAVDRLLALLPRLGEERIASIQKLDLRYPNGFSVVWKPDSAAPPEPTAPSTKGPV